MRLNKGVLQLHPECLPCGAGTAVVIPGTHFDKMVAYSPTAIAGDMDKDGALDSIVLPATEWAWVHSNFRYVPQPKKRA